MIATTISGRPPEDPILDWSALVEEGRATLAAMSDGRWTDFNVHDPGITILELICYALTDLGYRAQHPMADLLAGSTPLLGPAAGLTTRAVTPTDLRRLGLDVAGVRGVWIEPSTAVGLRLRHAPGARELGFDHGPAEGSEPVSIAGVHDVVIEKSTREDLPSASVVRAVALRLHAERNLGEDFGGFAVVEPQPIVVLADVEIDDPGRAEATLLDILARLDRYFSPQPQRQSAGALRAAGWTSDAIYDGPALERGVTGTVSGGRRRVLHLSDVIAELTQAEGVRATRRVRIGNSVIEADAGPLVWSLPVAADHVPGFDLRSSRIRLLTGGGVALDSTRRRDLAQRFTDRLRAESAAATMDEAPIAPGRDRGVGEYRPLRFDLPNAYGVRPGSLGRDWPPARRALANQLRAYLALIDAVLAGGFAQLAGAKALLAADVEAGLSYFAPAPERTPDEAAIFTAGLTDAALQDMVEVAGGPQATARLGRYLGHLLARFGEAAPSVPRPPGAGPDAAPDAEGLNAEAIVSTRVDFLRAFPRLSAGRGCGANLLLEGDESPLVERIRLKLGLPQTAADRLLLVEHILLRGIADDEPAALPLLASAARADPYSHQVSFILDNRLKAGPGDAEAVARVVRDECPAHLVTYLHWLPRARFEAFAEAHARWMAALRRHRREQLGLSEGRP